MKFANFEDTRIEATKGAKGFCPICGSALIAKCGEFKINHWAHKSISNCDRWWETEELWHRTWKNNFPTEWQEFVMFDEKTGEKHIADIRTDQKLVIEFQHSHIIPQERISREQFYKNVIWVVDGSRLKRDYDRFVKGCANIRETNILGHYIVGFPDECFPKTWIGSNVYVVFDFLGTESTEDPNDSRNDLYCLRSNRSSFDSELIVYDRENFIMDAISGDFMKEMTKQDRQINQPQKQAVSVRRSGFDYVYNRRLRGWEKRRRF